MDSNRSDTLIASPSNPHQHEEESEKDVLFSKIDIATVNSREFVEKIDEDLSNTDKLFIKMSANQSTCG